MPCRGAIDAGNRATASRTALLGYLNGRGITTIGTLVITNADADHAASCNEIFRDYEVLNFWHPGAPKDTDTWKECLDAAAAEPGLTTMTAENLGKYQLRYLAGAGQVRILNVASTGEINEGSIAFRGDFGDFSYILSGDIGCSTEDQIIASGQMLDVDLLQAGHHGSKTSTCLNWLNATAPEVVAIPVGANSYGHPTQEVLSRIESKHAQVLRTDLNGTFTIESDGTGYTITVAKHLAPTTPPPTTTPEPTPPSPPPTQPTPPAIVEISDIVYDPAGSDTGANLVNEYVEIHSLSSTALTMTGWTLRDDDSHIYTFPTFTLSPGAFVKVRTGTGTDSATDLYQGSGSGIWNNSGGDHAYLRDQNGAAVADQGYA